MTALDTASVLSLLIQIVLPIVVGLVTKRSWSPGFKAILLLILTAVTQFLTAWYDAAVAHIHYGWKVALWNIVIGFVISVAVHYGLWKPTGTSDKATDSLVVDSPRTAHGIK